MSNQSSHLRAASRSLSSSSADGLNLKTVTWLITWWEISGVNFLSYGGGVLSLLTSRRHVQPDQYSHLWHDRTGGLQAETLTSRRAMAADVPAAAEPFAVVVDCSCGEGEGGTMDRAGPFWLVGAVLVWKSICCNVRLRFGCKRRWVWLKISTATHFITPATRSS